MLNFDQGDGLIKEIMNSKDPISVVRQHVLRLRDSRRRAFINRSANTVCP